MINDALLQKAENLQETISGWRPFQNPELLAAVREFHKVPVVYSSNRIEGCTYTESETRILIEEGLVPVKKNDMDTNMVIGLAKAYDYMFSRVHKKEILLEDILFVHKLLVGGLQNDVVPGKFRDRAVYVTGGSTKFPQPSQVKTETEKLVADFHAKRTREHPVIAAADFHASLVRIHPFADGNGRVSRTMMNTVLIQEGWLPVIIPPILRQEYCDALEKYGRHPDEFRNFVLEHEVNSQKDFIRFMKPYMQKKFSEEKTTRSSDFICKAPKL